MVPLLHPHCSCATSLKLPLGHLKTTSLISSPFLIPMQMPSSLTQILQESNLTEKIHTKVLMTDSTITLMGVFDFVQREDLHLN